MGAPRRTTGTDQGAVSALLLCAQVTGVGLRQVESDYAEMSAEWHNLLGWCADKAFSNLDEVNSMYQEPLNLFYVLLQ
jgi:hypothetical protein